MIRKLLTRLKGRLLNLKKSADQDINYRIGNFSICLPHDHKLPEYQKAFKNYDKKFKNILESIAKHQDIKTIIDIGANVGDTAAFLRTYTKSKIICIEGDQMYLKYLSQNSKIIPNLTIVDAYVGSEDETFLGEVTRKDGTAKIIQNKNCSEMKVEVKTRSLHAILSNLKIDPDKIQLIKIDTDGYDFKILHSNKELIKQYKPNIYFEYDINFNDNDATDALNLVLFLETLGYILVIYDNFGNLMDLVESDHTIKMERYNHWLESSHNLGGGIYYLDIFATQNPEIARDLVKNDCKEIN